MSQWLIVALVAATAVFSGVECERVAVAQLSSGNITGSVTFTEVSDGVRVVGIITGLPPGLYGFHVHEAGDISTCDASGAHFNPEDLTHGGRDHSVRHVGDLGNVQFVNNNVANFDFVDHLISLSGRNNIVGRTLVLHENEDDLGLGGHENSLTTGNAGPRVACGVIGIRSPIEPWNSAAGIAPSLLLLFVSLCVYLFKY